MYRTVTALELAWLNVTVNSTASPSSAVAAGSMVSVGLPSSSSIVPVAVFGVPSSAFVDGLDSVTVNVSSSSCVVSPAVAIETVPVVLPAVTVSVPLAAVKSAPPGADASRVAVSPASTVAEYSTVTSLDDSASSSTVKTTAEPSVAVASSIVSAGSAGVNAVISPDAGPSARPAFVAITRTVYAVALARPVRR